MKKNAVEIRPWEESDRPFLRTIYLHARREGWPWLDGSEWQLEDFDADTLGETILVAQADGHRLGFASIAENDNFLHHLFVTPDAQGAASARPCLRPYRRGLPAPARLNVLKKTNARCAFTPATAGCRRGTATPRRALTCSCIFVNPDRKKRLPEEASVMARKAPGVTPRETRYRPGSLRPASRAAPPHGPPAGGKAW